MHKWHDLSLVLTHEMGEGDLAGGGGGYMRGPIVKRLVGKSGYPGATVCGGR